MSEVSHTKTISVIDVETTGLSPAKHDRIIEVGILQIDIANGQVLAEYETLINPQRDIGPQHIHQIASEDILEAPTFADVAPDILSNLSSSILLSGHNIAFDIRFLHAEFHRIGITLPTVKPFCTCQFFGRSSLIACCEEFGLDYGGEAHRALTDAKATAQILSLLINSDPDLLPTYINERYTWPSLPPTNKTPYTRTHASLRKNQTPSFLKRIISSAHHDNDAELPNVLTYMALIDRVLEDRIIDKREEELLIETASSLQLTRNQVETAHAHYIHNLVVAALADGVITDAERNDLHLVARLLGQDSTSMDQTLETAQAQLSTVSSTGRTHASNSQLTGKTVCFTGQLQATINGNPISRDTAEMLAMKAGMKIASSVTKKLDVLVVADPATQSGKAKKARDYGVRVLADRVFWQLADIPVD